jgi:glycosyltransferase involved in cell wall biosynthesis
MFGSAARWLVNVADLSPAGAKFVELPADIHWLDFSGLPQNLLERLVSKPKISRYRAAFQAARAARGMPIISHLPRMTAAVSKAQSLLRQSSPHVAFSFNFTDLPVGRTHRYMANAFSSVDEFFVFSEFEFETYPRYFSQPLERFTKLRWTQDPPKVSNQSLASLPNRYVSAVGGEGRDYQTLVAAAEKLPNIEFVLIARPYNVVGSLPPNVRLLTNVPADVTWRIALESSCLVVPLKARTTCCGHITLVSGELLGIPVISTFAEATREYTEDVALCEPADVASLARLVREHHEQSTEFRRAAMERVPAKLAKYSRKLWDAAVWTALKGYF